MPIKPSIKRKTGPSGSACTRRQAHFRGSAKASFSCTLGWAFRVGRSYSFTIHRPAASRTFRRVAGAAEWFGAARTRILACGLREMQSFVANQTRRVQAPPPFAQRRLGQADERVPVDLDYTLAFATADQNLEPLHRDEQLQGLNPIESDAQGVFVLKVAQLIQVLALDRRNPLMFAPAVRLRFGPLHAFKRRQACQGFPTEVVMVAVQAGVVARQAT